MKRALLAAAFLAASIFSAPAQFASSCPPGGAPCPQVIGAPVGSPTYVTPPSGGIIDIGQAFGGVIGEDINAAINALILAGATAFVGWLAAELKKRFGVTLDQGHRDALVRALQNQAGSLIADGMVKMEGTTVTVDNKALADSANEVLAVIPDAAKHLGLTPDYVSARIKDFIPQTAAGAAMIAAAQPKA